MANFFDRINSLKNMFQLSNYGNDDEVAHVVNEVSQKKKPKSIPKKKKTKVEVRSVATFELRKAKDLVMGSQILSSFPIPLRQPKNDLNRDYERKINDYNYKITASREFGYPCGQDALILLFIEDIARKTKNKKVYLDSLWRILSSLGLGDGSKQYSRLELSIKRLFHAKFMIFKKDDTAGLNIEVFEAIHLKGITENWREDLGNFILLTESHFDRVMHNEVPYDMEVFRILSHSAGASRMYRFVAPRAFTAASSSTGVIHINAIDFLNQLGCEPYGSKRKRKQMILRWKTECNDASIATGVGSFPLTINDHDVVSMFPKHLVPGVSATIENCNTTKARLSKPKSEKKNRSKIREFDLDWVLEKEIEDFNNGTTTAISQAAAKYMSAKVDANL